MALVCFHTKTTEFTKKIRAKFGVSISTTVVNVLIVDNEDIME